MLLMCYSSALDGSGDVEGAEGQQGARHPGSGHLQRGTDHLQHEVPYDPLQGGDHAAEPGQHGTPGD